MSKSAWGIAASAFFGIFTAVLPLPDTLKIGVWTASGVGLLVCSVGYWRSHRNEIKRQIALTSDEEPDAPKFDTFEPRIEYHEVINKFEISIGYRNIGKRRALDVETAIWVSDCSLTRDSVVRKHESAGDVPPNSDRFFGVTFSISKPEIRPHFIVLIISYRGSRQHEHLEKQPFFYKWVGIKNGITNAALYIASREERSAIEHKMAEELRDLS
jgi:hypothetical protein